MKLSIWQQFSSNHSAGFVLIAQFQTVDETDRAAAIIQHFINTIAAWYEQHPELNDEEMPLLTLPEAHLAAKYNLTDWDYSVDWAVVEANPRIANHGFYTYQNLIFLNNPMETWLNAQPFDELLVKLGAQISVVNYGIDSRFVPAVNITCSAATEAAATDLVERLSSVQERSDGSERPVIKLPDVAFPYIGIVRSAGNQVECKSLPIATYSREFHRTHLADFLPHLVRYLEQQGCREITFSAANMPYEEVE